LRLETTLCASGTTKVGVLMATVLYDSVGPRALFGFLAVAPWVCMALPWWHFHEDRYGAEE